MQKHLSLLLLAGALPMAAAVQAVDFGKLPLHFEPNRGQTHDSVRYLARTPSGTLFLTDSETVWTRGDGVLRMRFAGGAQAKSWASEGKLPGITSYFKSDVKSSGIPQFSRVKASGIYPGVDVAYYGTGRELEYDFIVHPQADPAAIQLSFSGAKNVRVDAGGDLLVTTSFGELRMRRPVALQDNREVACSYRLSKHGTVRFELGRYDRSRELVIDPVVASLSYSTLLGGNAVDRASGIATDSAGNTYVAGTTRSTDFPLGTNFGTRTVDDAFVAKLNATGTTLLFAVYLGGTGSEAGQSVAVDDFGNVYVSGSTNSTNFPLQSANQGSNNGQTDAFLAKLNATGTALVYSTYLGGSGDDEGYALAVNKATGEAFIGGTTRSGNFPTTAPLKASLTGNIEGFLAKYSTTGTRLFSTYWGGAGFGNPPTHEGVSVRALALDSAGNPVFTGFGGAILPTTPGAAVATSAANQNKGYVAKLSANGSTVLLATYTQGITVNPQAIAVDASNKIYIAGWYLIQYADSQSGGRPLTNDVFYGVLTADGAAWQTLGDIVGTTADDEAAGIAVSGPEPMIYLTGTARSGNFPSTVTLGSGGGLEDAFIAKIHSVSKQVEYISRVGGDFSDGANAIAVTPDARPVIAGYTFSTSGNNRYPTTAGVIRSAASGTMDAFVTKLNETACTSSLNPTSFAALAGGGNSTVAVTSNCAWTATTTTPWITITSGATGSGNGNVGFSVQANATGAARSGSITIAGITFNITQPAATGCTVTLNQNSAAIPGSGAIRVIPITASSSTCPVTAVANVPWIKVFTLNTYVQITVDTNPANSPRSGTVTVNGQTFTVNQAGEACTYTLSSAAVTLGPNGNLSGQPVTLTASAANCAWVTSSAEPWIQVSPQTGTGTVNVTVTVAPNFATTQRSAAASIAGRPFTVTQTASAESENHRFVRLLYFSFFGRTASDAEVQFQVNSLLANQQTRGEMVVAFMNTPEFNNGARFVAGLYVGLLDRDAEHGGWQFQRNALANGLVSPLDLATNFIGGGEYAGRFGNPSNEEYVRLLYQYVLLRQPSNNEVAFHVGTLSPTFTRANMAMNFLQSNEFRTGTGPRLMSFLISAGLQLRDPTQEERATRIAQLQANTPLRTLVEAVFPTAAFRALLD